jgi:hypothetical protein
MANTATALTKIPVQVSADFKGYQSITPVACTFDTLALDLTIYTPAAANYAAIVGLVYQEADAHNLVITSGSTVLVTLQRAANDSAGLPVGAGGCLIVGGLGQALKLQCTTAVIASLLVYVAEFPKINFLGR